MMISLYRGIVDILINQTEILNKQFVKHIRTFNDGDPAGNFGTAGFWNLLLEVTYIFYVKTFVAIGIGITILLALVFFPLSAFRKLLSGVFTVAMPRHEKEPMTYEEPKEPKIEPIQDNIIITK
jgi:hypothetical protein